MPVTFEIIPEDVATAAFADAAAKHTERHPRDEVFNNMVAPFIATGRIHLQVPVKDDDGNIIGARGITWNELQSDDKSDPKSSHPTATWSQVTEALQDYPPKGGWKDDSPNLRDLAKIINAQNNRNKWQVYAKVDVIAPQSEVLGIQLVNEKLEKEARKADLAAKAAEADKPEPAVKAA